MPTFLKWVASSSKTVLTGFCILGHLVEAKYLIDNAGVDSQKIYGEFSRLLAWVEYHVVMSRFSLRHWQINVEPVKGIRNVTPKEQESCLLRKVRLNNMKLYVCIVICLI
jgi:hypothetical protein